MSAISSVSENYYVSSDEEEEETTDTGTLGNEDFMLLLMTELQNQDPLEPMGTSEMMSQISSLESLNEQISQSETLEAMAEEISAMSTALTTLSSANQLQSASAMVGMYVTGKDSSGNEVSGMVTSAALNNGSVTLSLHTGDSLPYGNVTEVTMAVVDDEETDTSTETAA